MKRRLLEAYDAMMMPDSCARRIEQQLTARQGRRNVEVYTPPKRNWWVLAAGLVCLVLVLSAGGTFLLLNAANHTAAKTPEPAVTQPPVLETTAETSEKTMGFFLSENGKEFLEKMCYYMPDWPENGVLDDTFWREFLFATFTSPELLEDGKAMTVCGEASYVAVGHQGMLKISREAAAEYVALATGRELPEDFQPDGPEIFYEDGYYYIAPSDFGSVGYTFREWEPCFDFSPSPAFARFDIYVDEPENVVGTVTFVVNPAENENGFTISCKESVTPAGP